MKKLVLILSGLFMFGAVAVGSEYKIKGLGFIAPQVSDKSNVSSPHIGEIVFDSSDSKFWGRDTGSSWVDLTAGATGAVPTGTIMAFGGTVAPAGFALCDGSLHSRETDAALFNVIGTAYGDGDGEFTFNVPDLRGRFLRGVDGTAGIDPDAASRTALNGGNSGNAVGSVQSDMFRSHQHTYGGAVGSSGVPGSFFAGQTVHNTDPATGAAGGNETRPVNVYVNYIIKL